MNVVSGFSHRRNELFILLGNYPDIVDRLYSLMLQPLDSAIEQPQLPLILCTGLIPDFFASVHMLNIVLDKHELGPFSIDVLLDRFVQKEHAQVIENDDVVLRLGQESIRFFHHARQIFLRTVPVEEDFLVVLPFCRLIGNQSHLPKELRVVAILLGFHIRLRVFIGKDIERAVGTCDSLQDAERVDRITGVDWKQLSRNVQYLFSHRYLILNWL